MKLGIKKGNQRKIISNMPIHYPADRVYLDGDTTKSVQDKVARKADLTNLDLTGTTNTTGSTIAAGTYFYLNGVLVRAKTDIASGATFTSGTNYEAVTAGALNDLRWKRKYSADATTDAFNITEPFNEVLISASSTAGSTAAKCSLHFVKGIAEDKRIGWYTDDNNFAWFEVRYDGNTYFICSYYGNAGYVTSYKNILYR